MLGGAEKDEDKCKANSENTKKNGGVSKKLIAIVVPVVVVGVAAILVAAVLVIPKLRNYVKVRRGVKIHKDHELANVSNNEDPVTIERRNNMELNTVAGNYTVEM